MLTPDQRTQFSELLEELGQALDISESQYDIAIRSYQAVGAHLSKEESVIAPYQPEILPQGSFLLGTMIKPINEKDDLDIDLVCQLTAKQRSWTQYDLKQKVGDQLKRSPIYNPMLKEEGRRCWTLHYADSSNYHMDILPTIVDSGYRIILEKSISDSQLSNLDRLAMRITDKKRRDYLIETDPKLWLKSNPFGYGRWFFNRSSPSLIKGFSIMEAIKPVPKYQKEKLPLQRIVQILKRHRDLMFNGDEHKPISIIITTLAAKAYNSENSVIEGLQNVIEQMPNFIEERFNPETGRVIKWVGNPVNDQENFADKWEENPEKQIKFYEWLTEVKNNIRHSLNQKDKGLHHIMESLKAPFGEKEVSKAFASYGDKQLRLRENSGLKMAGITGTLGNTGRTTIPQHTNFGASKDK